MIRSFHLYRSDWLFREGDSRVPAVCPDGVELFLGIAPETACLDVSDLPFDGAIRVHIIRPEDPDDADYEVFLDPPVRMPDTEDCIDHIDVFSWLYDQVYDSPDGEVFIRITESREVGE